MASRSTVLLLSVVVLTGCKKESRGREKLKRSPDAAAVVVTSGARATAAGPLLKEVEPNERPDGLVAIEMPFQVAGDLPEKDTDYILVEAPEQGVISAKVVPSENLDVVLSIEKGGEVFAVSDQGSAGKPEAVPNWPTEVGQVAIRVDTFSKKKKKKEQDDKAPRTYLLDVRFTPLGGVEPTWEMEPNETGDNSQAIASEKRQFGYLGWAKDVDVWRISVEDWTYGNVLDIFLDGVPGVAPTLRVTRRGEVEALVSRSGGKGSSLSIQSFVPRREHGEYVITVSGTRSNPFRQYALWARERIPAAGEELEPNDTESESTVLAKTSSSSGTQRGSFGPGDVDYFTLPTEGEYRLELKPTRDGSGKLSVFIDGVAGVSEKGQRGEAVVLANVVIPTGTSGKIKVEGRSRGAASAEYELRWQRLSP